MNDIEKTLGSALWKVMCAYIRTQGLPSGRKVYWTLMPERFNVRKFDSRMEAVLAILHESDKISKFRQENGDE